MRFGLTLGVILIIMSAFLLAFGWRCGVVQSSSMAPKINVGSFLIWQKTTLNSNQIAVGEVVLFSQNDRVLAHRVISKSGNYITVKGDSAHSSSQTITSDKIIGKYIFSFDLGQILLIFFLVCGVVVMIFKFAMVIKRKR